LLLGRFGYTITSPGMTICVVNSHIISSVAHPKYIWVKWDGFKRSGITLQAINFFQVPSSTNRLFPPSFSCGSDASLIFLISMGLSTLARRSGLKTHFTGPIKYSYVTGLVFSYGKVT
jgi:hypothetical protein